MLCADPSMDEDYDEMLGDLFDDAEVHLEAFGEENQEGGSQEGGSQEGGSQEGGPQEGGSDRFFFGCQGLKLRALCTGVCVSHFWFY